MQPGIYILLLSAKSAELQVGALGILPFSEGYYAYVGSALGPGGLARVSRHIKVARNKDRAPRWHIDYLLMDKRFTLTRVYCIHTADRLECLLAKAIPLPYIPHFGSSDCLCVSHLFISSQDPDALIRKACRSLGRDTIIHSIR
jgi:Uri superfamily endonuclease